MARARHPSAAANGGSFTARVSNDISCSCGVASRTRRPSSGVAKIQKMAE